MQLRVQAPILCPRAVAQTAKSKSKELKDVVVSSKNQRTSGGQSSTHETPSCFESNDLSLGSAESTRGGTGKRRAAG